MVVGCKTCIRNDGHESLCETRVVSRGSSEFTYPGENVTGELLCGEKSRKTEPTRGQHLLSIGGMVQPLLLEKK